MKIERTPVNNAKGRKKNERRSTEMKQMTGTGSTKCLKRSTGLMDPTQMSAYHGWTRYLPWPAPTREMPEMNSSSTVVEVFRRPCISCPQVLQRMKFVTFCCIITLISKLLPTIYLLLTLSNRYQSYYELAHEGLTITSNRSKVSCIHYAKSLHGKLGEELEGRFNQRLPDNLQDAFDRAVDFEPRILTSQCIHTRNVNEINHIDASGNYQEFEVNEAQHICNPNYKGKNYDPNYQKNKNNQNNSSNSTYNKNNNSNNGTTSGNFRSKGDYTALPSNVEVTLKGPVNQDQLTKIKEILKNPQIYKDKVQKNQYPASGECTTSFSKFCPRKVEVNEVTVNDVTMACT